MARGKHTCKILKDIRRQIAEANDIEFITSECQYKGDCLGTCPKCEAELRYLDEQLTLRRLAGKAIVIAGLSAGLLSVSSCSSPANKSENADNIEINSCEDPFEDLEEMGEVPIEDIASLEESDERYEFPPDPGEIDEENSNGEPVTNILVTGEDIDPDELDRILRERAEEPYNIAVIEVQPQFPGGQEEMYKWISENIIYPEDALSEGIEGRVVVEFIIDANGNIESTRVLRGRWPSLDEEALRVISSMPKWTPGKMGDKNVKCIYTLPVAFRLPKD